MNYYKELTDAEIENYRNQLVEPKENYPHYAPLVIDGKNVHEYMDLTPLNGEKFIKNNTYEYLKVSNYGRISYKNEIVNLYISGTFLHCTRFHIAEIGDHAVYRIVKETFDPIENMADFQVHHINNNALDNRLGNLLWVTERDHRKIDKDFNAKLIQISKIIHQNEKDNLKELFLKNPNKTFTGFDICSIHYNVFAYVIRDMLDVLIKEDIIVDISENKNIFYDKIYKLNKPNFA
jgi:hypothetical protein